MTLHTHSRLEHGLEGLHAFSYLSIPTVPFSDGDLSDLLRAASTANARLGVTGKLVVMEDDQGVARFAQWIEGTRLELDACIGRIRADGRHHQFIVQYDGPVHARRFPDWDMVMESVDEKEFPAVSHELLRVA